jgi:hypothetical protein
MKAEDVVDKKKLLEWVRKSGLKFNYDNPESMSFVVSEELIDLIKSGELDPDIRKCEECNCQEFAEDPNQFICKRCGLCVGKTTDPPNILEEGLKQCFPGVEFVTSGEKK